MLRHDHYVIYFRVAKDKMVRSCCAIDCTTREVKETKEAGVQFYRIPQGPEKRMLWINAIRRKDWTPSSYSVICSKHFIGGSPRSFVGHQ